MDVYTNLLGAIFAAITKVFVEDQQDRKIASHMSEAERESWWPTPGPPFGAEEAVADAIAEDHARNKARSFLDEVAKKVGQEINKSHPGAYFCNVEPVTSERKVRLTVICNGKHVELHYTTVLYTTVLFEHGRGGITISFDHVKESAVARFNSLVSEFPDNLIRPID